jgi:hypothetical protein
MTRTISALFLLWAGLLLGVSFVATPAKFLAPSLPMTQALDVGRWTFHVLGLIEWALVVVAAGLIAVAWMRDAGRIGTAAVLLAAIAGILAAETFFIRPALNERTLRIIAGQSVLPSRLHSLYVGLEVLKLTLTLAAGIVGIRQLGAPPHASGYNMRGPA